MDPHDHPDYGEFRARFLSYERQRRGFFDVPEVEIDLAFNGYLRSVYPEGASNREGNQSMTPGQQFGPGAGWFDWGRNEGAGNADASPMDQFMAGLGQSYGPMPEQYVPTLQTELYPPCRVPLQFRMRHQRSHGQHIAYLGNTIAATFTAKKAANEFCRAWNTMMSHLGQAAQFRTDDLVTLFSNVVVGGSGEFGVVNQFEPPMHGM